MTTPRPGEPPALVVWHRHPDADDWRIVLDDQGIRQAVRVDPADDRADAPDAVDLVVRRSLAAERADAAAAWTPGRLAETTDLLVDGAALAPWGMARAVTVPGPGIAPCALRFRTDGSPFAGRPLVFDLRVVGGTLRTGLASGRADLEVRAPWRAVATWLTEPALLFADVFDGPLQLRGELAVLSLFEGLRWIVGEERPTSVAAVRRWGELWSSPAVRVDLGWWVAELSEGRT